MSPEQITLVQTTLASLSAIQLDALAADFYVRLFAADPSLVALFGGDPTVQRAKFAGELAAIVHAIRRFDEFASEGAALGCRHRRYGVSAGHYLTAGVALLGALADALGPAWTPAAADAWRLAYHLTAEVMIAGSAGVDP
jgi:hemoglobin-like flavoprotein